jgi:hypothetical protein
MADFGFGSDRSWPFSRSSAVTIQRGIGPSDEWNDDDYDVLGDGSCA